jgi:dipeptidase D
MTFVASLEPRTLWTHFDRILEIPRGSRNEGQIRAYVLQVADRHGLEHRTDAAGNVLVHKPASPGREHAPVTVLQSHLDMVNEKNQDVEHDFDRDPIRPDRHGDYLRASGTTLGADNGIGVAAMLAILEDPDLVHGPLELLFTVDEETGLTGASGLDGSMIRGRRLLNLDTEEHGTIYVGCAGGGDTTLRLPVAWVPAPASATPFELSLRGLKGGHSGVDIHLQRGNAIQLLARIVDAAARENPLLLAALHGGNMRNAIPREATATVVLHQDHAGAFQAAAGRELDRVREALAAVEPDLRLEIRSPDEPPARVLDAHTSRRTLDLLLALPHGVSAMSPDIPGLVETSTNLAVVRTESEHITILTNTRSSVAAELEALRARIRAAASLAGAVVESLPAYPGWKPDLRSPLLHVVRQTCSACLGRDPEIKAVHAGLETGIIGTHVPGMDMVSLGPQIEFPHSPDERVHIPSVAEFFGLLAEVLEALSVSEEGERS